jgi:subtilisin family serine protease
MKTVAPFLTLLLVLPPAAGFAAPPTLEASSPDDTTPVWVHFTDKGTFSDAELERALRDARDALTERARARRAKVRGAEIVDGLDLPLSGAYVDAVLATGARLRARMKWVNAISVEATHRQRDAIARLPFVAAVRPVARARRTPEPIVPVETGRLPGPSRGSLNYGECSSQIVPIQIDRLHDAGYSGAGILIGAFDTGFQLTHAALDSVDVQAQWDFVNDDPVVENEPGDHPNQHNHGTSVLSIVAGWDPGNLIGPAYGASYVLAKTESLDYEQPVEEDFWAAAAVWAESLGVDVITTSLGYHDWYTWEDLDGNTATITIAADLAVANGVSVVTSAGNEGTQDWTYVLMPADGDSVISVGAVDSLDVFQLFSSRGPTWDGRIKPDVCAMGSGVLVAIANTTSDYGRGGGTSFAAPLVAGASALLLEAHPSWGPIEVREALRSTATQASSPDTAVGWGVIRAADASAWATAAPRPAVAAGPAARLIVAPNPAVGASEIRWTLPAEAARAPAELAVFDVGGRRIRTLWAGEAVARGRAAWDGRDENGRLVPTGIYFARLETAAGTVGARVVRIR